VPSIKAKLDMFQDNIMSRGGTNDRHRDRPGPTQPASWDKLDTSLDHDMASPSRRNERCTTYEDDRHKNKIAKRKVYLFDDGDIHALPFRLNPIQKREPRDRRLDFDYLMSGDLDPRPTWSSQSVRANQAIRRRGGVTLKFHN